MMATVIRVLYVDDEPSLLELAKIFLERYGDFAVTVATSAAEAIRILRQERFDTIVSDYQMPDMDGIAFLRHLKAEGNTTPFIIFTGKGREEVVIEAFNAGADFYIQKGGEAKSQFAELVHKVQRAVQHHIDEKALLESEVRFRALVENASDIIRILNRDGRIVFDTAASSRQLGYPSGYTLGRDPFEFIHPDDLALVKEEFLKIYAKTNNGVPTEFRIRKADGSYIWVESIGKNLIGVPGIDGVVITTRFIDERKRAEAERRESEEKFRQLFSGMPSGVAIYEAVLHGEDFVFRDFNAAGEAIEHIKREEVIGRRVTEVFPGVKEFGVFSVFQRVWRTGKPEFFPLAVYRDPRDPGTWRENWIYRLPTGEIVAIYNDVTERKTAEDALRESEKKYHTILDSVQDAYIRADAKGDIIMASPSAAHLFRYDSVNDLIGLPAASLYLRPEERQEIIRIVKEQGEVHDYISEGVRKDGSGFWVSMNVQFTFDSKGQVTGTDGFIRDITDRKASEQTLREREAYYRALFENTGTASVIVEEDTTISLANEGFAVLSGYPREEIEGKKRWTEFVVKEDLERMLTQHRLRRKDRKQAERNYEFRFIRKSGEVRNIYLSIDVISGTKKSIASLLDITARKQAEEALRESEERYRTVIEDQTEFICRFTADGRLTFVNDAYCRYFSLDKDQCLTRPHSVVLPPEDARLMRQHLASLTPKNPVATIEHRILMPSEEVRWQWWNDRAIFDRNGHVAEYQSVGRDTTEQKIAEIAMRESEARFSTIFEKSPVATCITQINDGKIIDVNDALLTMFGYARDEMIGHTTLELNIWALPEEREKVISQLRDRGMIKNLETRFSKKTGETGDVLVSAEIIGIAGEQYMLTLMQDITERKRIEEELRGSEARLDLALHSTGMGVWYWNIIKNRLYFDVQTCNLLGIDPATFTGSAEEFFAVVHPDDHEKLKMALIRTVEHDILYEPSYRAIWPDRSIHLITARGRLVRDAKGKPEQINGIVWDITEQKTAEDALRESEKQYHSILDNMQDAYVRADTKGHIIMASPSAAHLFRYDSVNDLIGLPAASLYRHPKERQEIIRIVKERGEVHDYICEGMRKDGSGFWVSMNVQFTFDSKGRVTGSDGFIRDITERKASEQALIKSQIQLAEAMDLANLVNWEFDVASGIFTFNDRFYALYGTTAEREGGYQMPAEVYAREFVHPDEVGVVADEVQKAIIATDPNYTTQIEHRIIRRDGAIRHIIVRYGITKDAEGRMVKTLGANQDITERKRAEEELQNSLTFLNNLIDQSPTPMWISDENGTLIRINKACCDLLNISEMDVVGKYNILSDNLVKKQGFLSLVRDVFDKGQVAHFQITYDTGKLNALDLARSASVILDVTIFPVKDTHGKITNAVIQHINISDRKRVEEALRESEEQYRSLLEHVPELILVHKNGIILYTNPAAVKTLGYHPYEALNRQIIDFIAPEYHERVAAAVRRRMSGEPVEPYEIDVMSRDGSRRTMIINGCQIEFEGAPASLIVLVDITEQKVLHDAVRLANKKLNLLSNITRHDIVNQLLALNGYLELSREILDDPVKLAEFITKEQNIASTMQTQILFTKDYQDLGIHAPVWQNVHESVVNARENLPLRGIAVETDSPTLEVYADPLLVRVFYNLIDNALRYGGGQMTTIRISSQESSRGLVIVCEDDGVGIPADKKEAIFNREYFKHTGFGLFLSREILAITGITIIENSTPGKGARFEITVPKGAYRFMGTGKNKPEK